MDDIDLNLAFGQQIAAIAQLLYTAASDSAVSASNAGFIICDLDGPGINSHALVTAAAVGGDGAHRPSSDGDGPDDELSRFVQFGVDPHEITLDQPTSTLAIAEGERLLREREGFRMERGLVSTRGGGTTFSESLVKTYEMGAFPDLRRRCHAAAVDVVWIIHELWGLDPQIPITVTAFTHDGSGNLPSLDGPLCGEVR